MSPRDQAWIELLREAAMEADHREIGDVDRDTRLDALELDSLAFMQVIAFFEERLDRRLPNRRFSRARTVGDFLDVLADDGDAR